ncbi:MAG: hypothetical protein IKN54_02635 [Lachnospiraceae bacterium]|nr:hypothetical protein [Lachnospiraceae bacterium]
MTIIDKAVWQVDGGVPEDLVVNHFNTVFADNDANNYRWKIAIIYYEDVVNVCYDRSIGKKRIICFLIRDIINE